MKTRSILILQMILMLSSCSVKESDKGEGQVIEEVKYPYSFIHQLSPQIDYSLAEKNKNGKEIRIWIKDELLIGPKTLIELTQVDSNTYLKWIRFNYSKENRKFKLDSLKLTCQKVDLSIDSVTAHLKRIGFDKVQSQPDSIKQLIGDGTTYVIEVKQNEYYKVVDCNIPQAFDDANNKTLTGVLKYLSGVFGFYYNEAKI